MKKNIKIKKDKTEVVETKKDIKPARTRVLNATILKDEVFLASCLRAKIPATKRQASKWVRKIGEAWKAHLRMEFEKKETK
jgi:hypothetical protein